MNEFPALHDTLEEVIIKHNNTLRSVTADSSSQTDPPIPPLNRGTHTLPNRQPPLHSTRPHLDQGDAAQINIIK